MRPLRIPCLFHTEESKSLEKLEMDATIEQLEVRDAYFFKIETVYSAREQHSDGSQIEVTCISSGGMIYETTRRLDLVLGDIERWMNSKAL